MLIGLLLTSAVWTNALPNVVWRRTAAPPTTTAAVTPSPTATPAPIAVPAPQGLGPLPLPVPTLLPGYTSPPVPATSPLPTPPTTAEPTSEATTVVAGGWASAYAGTPLAEFGVPEGDVVVSAHGAQPENITYLKLQGDGTPLVLQVDQSGTNVLADLAVLRLCAVTSPSWRVGRGDVALDQAPATDCGRAIDGVRSADGTSWTFDLSAVDLTGATGVAIVPVAAGTSPQFHVVLRLPSPSSASTSAP